MKRPRAGFAAPFHVVSVVALPLITSVYVGIARRAVEIATEQGTVARWRADLDDIAQVLAESDAAPVFADTRLPVDRRTAMVDRVLDVQPLARNLAKLLVTRGRSGDARAVADAFGRMADEAEGIAHAEITTAVPLSADPTPDYSLRALCLDPKSGSIVWDEEVFVESGKGFQPHRKNSHASPTPVSDGQRVYVHFGHQGTACLDFDGKVVWTRPSADCAPRSRSRDRRMPGVSWSTRSASWRT